MKALTEPTTPGASGGEGPTKAQILPVHKRVSFVFIDCHRFLIENLQFELGLENNPLFADAKNKNKQKKSIKINSETCAQFHSKNNISTFAGSGQVKFDESNVVVSLNINPAANWSLHSSSEAETLGCVLRKPNHSRNTKLEHKSGKQ